MKNVYALRCPECEDVKALRPQLRHRHCGSSMGYFVDGEPILIGRANLLKIPEITSFIMTGKPPPYWFDEAQRLRDVGLSYRDIAPALRS